MRVIYPVNAKLSHLGVDMPEFHEWQWKHAREAKDRLR